MNNKDLFKKMCAAFLTLVPYVIAIASAITAITPNQSDDQVLATIKQIADVLALNIGHNANDTNASSSIQCNENND
jgi:hypothetical protein